MFVAEVLKQIMEMKNDIECIYEEITRQASEHINEKDIIMTYGQSDLLCSFLKSAFTGGDFSDEEESQGGKAVAKNQGKDFEVLVCETAPIFDGHKTAKIL